MNSAQRTISLFQDWKEELNKHIKLILIVSIIASIGGLSYSLVKKPKFTSSTSFVLENSEGGAGGLGQYLGLASMMGIELGDGGGVFHGDNILELYRSRQMIQKALLMPMQADTSQLLIERYLQYNPIKGGDIPFKTPQLTRLQDSVIREVVLKINKKNLRVARPNQRLDVIKVDVVANDEAFAKEFNNQIVKTVNEFYIQTKTKKSADNIAILQHKTDSVRAVMNGDIYTAAITTDLTPNINPTRQVQRTVPVQRSQFSAETNKAVLEELLKNLELSKITILKETPLIQVIDEPIYPLEKEKNYWWAYTFISLFMGLVCTAVLILLRHSVRQKLN